MPTGIGEFILKVHGRCNLACDHCYVYEHSDQSWRTKPRAMSTSVAVKVGQRIAEHLRAHGLRRVRVVLHGGEPLLLGVSRMRELITALRAQTRAVTSMSLSVQTNGVLLSEEFCRLFDQCGVSVGVSLDGDRTANDRHRRFADGRSSHFGVRRGLALLRRPEFRHLYGGILCTVDLDNDPMDVYEALMAELPPRLDFLLPQATWANPPPRHGEVPAPYAWWLGRIYTRWDRDGRPVPIRLFDSLVRAARGFPSGSEAVGLGPVALAVVETDGSWEQADSLKTAYEHAPATGMTVFTHSVDDVTGHPGVSARIKGYDALCKECKACPVVRSCGGGLYAHRYRPGSGFDNPSVYCADLKALTLQVVGPRRRGDGGIEVRRLPEPAHVLTDGDFDAFAAGAGTVSGMRALLEMRLSLNRALVAAVASDGRRSDSGPAASGWQLLTELDVSHPAETAEVLGHPCIQPWAMRCLRADDTTHLERERAHLAGVAAAAAWRAESDATLPLPVRDGLVYLPGVGAYRTAADGPTAMFSAADVDACADEWLEVRRLHTPHLSLAVDDLDPYRGCPHDPVTDRLPAARWKVWRDLLTGGGSEAARLVPDYAAVLRVGLQAVIPVSGSITSLGEGGQGRGPSGSIYVAATSDGDLVETLLWRFQHVKLTALLYMYEFFSKDSPLLKVPWRLKAIPVREIFYDLYESAALAELWCSRRARARGRDEGGLDAAMVFGHHRTRVRQATDALASKGSLTHHGLRFITGLRRRIDGLDTAYGGASEASPTGRPGDLLET
ncbi:FxsB family cyclophane-forming radical SAM/SPASM peptide maturase [Microbispora rosea]|uniref:FxsB family cyclophane-forming radical SAM/SPASM peptide maturase n=1 Tax=Microbispora rosea TaxID=58117 RepID=UPI0037A683C3